MKTSFFRIILIAVVVAGLVGMQPGGAVMATPGGIGGHWVSRPPALYGMAISADWGSAAVIAYTNFQVRYQNDAQFLYLLIDVTNERSGGSPISPNENFSVYFDVDQNGTGTAGVDLNYYIKPAMSYNLLQQKSLGGSSWSSGQPSASYHAAGYNSSPALDYYHRTYGAAIRLSDLQALPGHTVKAGFWVSSTNPVFTESQPADLKNMANYTTLTLASPTVAFIYNTTQGLADAQAFQTVLANYGGFTTDLIMLDQVASVDFSSYQSIIIGHDTGDDSNHTWFGSAAAGTQIKQSGKPVLGIGYGGSELFDDLGVYIGWPPATFSVSGNVDIQSGDHAAWNFPNDLPKGTPFAVYSTTVDDRVVHITSSSLARQLTLLANHAAHPDYFPFIGQKLNGVCYTLWGFLSHPELLTTNGKKLFANMVANPICLPSVLYLGGSDTTLRDGIETMLGRGGFYTEHALASATSTLDLTGYGLIVVGWDTLSAWTTPANVNAIRNSHLPVLAMGEGGVHLFVDLGLSYNGTTSSTVAPQTAVYMFNPLQSVMRKPYPILVDSTYVATLDGSAGVTEYLLAAKFPKQIGNLVSDPSLHSILTQIDNGACYSFWGFENYAANMTVLAKNLFRNMLANPSCLYGQFVPAVHK